MSGRSASSGASALRRAGRDRLVVAAQVVDREVPAGSLMADDALDNGERARFGCATVMEDPAHQGRDPRKPPPGEVGRQLELGADARLDAAEQLQRVPFVHEQDAVALIGGAAYPAAFGREIELGSCEQATQAAGAGWQFATVLDQAQQAVAQVVVEDAVDERALARAGDPGEHAGRVLLDRAVRRLARHGRQRQQVGLGPPVGVARPTPARRTPACCPSRIVAQSEKRAWPISRDFDANQRWRFRNGTSACRSSMRACAGARARPAQSTPTSSAGSAVGERRVRIVRRARRHLRHLHRRRAAG